MTMNDVAEVLDARTNLERGLSGPFIASFAFHLLLFAGPAILLMLSPRPPVLRVQDGFAIALPRGGGGVPQANPAPPAPAPVEPQPAKVETERPAPAPPRVLKPPTEPVRRGIPELDSKSRRPTPPAPSQARPGASSATATPGLSFAPPGPGIPGGSALDGDWYLASVQQKIWSLWSLQPKPGMTQSIAVTFTILANGAVADVSITQPSGNYLLDSAAQRAIYSAAPFSPLPKHYGTTRFTIQAIFKSVN